MCSVVPHEDRTRALLQWAWEEFGDAVALSSSFQTQSVPLLHLLSQVAPEIPVLFVDTGYHFLETLTFRDSLAEMLGLQVKNLRGPEKKGRDRPYAADPDACCFVRKVLPLQAALTHYRAWITGVRRDQTAARHNLAEKEETSDGLLRIHPMLHWSRRDVWSYLRRHDLPEHPLLKEGYASIGCAPCTAPAVLGERSGRWGGTKSECGLHTEM